MLKNCICQRERKESFSDVGLLYFSVIDLQHMPSFGRESSPPFFLLDASSGTGVINPDCFKMHSLDGTLSGVWQVETHIVSVVSPSLHFFHFTAPREVEEVGAIRLHAARFND